MLEAYKTCDCCKHLIIDISFCRERNMFIPYAYDYGCPDWKLKEEKHEIN